MKLEIGDIIQYSEVSPKCNIQGNLTITGITYKHDEKYKETDIINMIYTKDEIGERFIIRNPKSSCLKLIQKKENIEDKRNKNKQENVETKETSVDTNVENQLISVLESMDKTFKSIDDKLDSIAKYMGKLYERR